MAAFLENLSEFTQTIHKNGFIEKQEDENYPCKCIIIFYFGMGADFYTVLRDLVSVDIIINTNIS